MNGLTWRITREDPTKTISCLFDWCNAYSNAFNFFTDRRLSRMQLQYNKDGISAIINTTNMV
ncbi:hypothetical protein LBMAG25_02700 [Bacteroidota bacterium]|nr:hypothetical protein LBMAG25_02700 [Bacteroidota bacterium]